MGVAEEPVAAVGKLGIAGNRKGEDREGDERNPHKPDLSRADLFKANLFQTILSRANLSHDFSHRRLALTERIGCKANVSRMPARPIVPEKGQPSGSPGPDTGRHFLLKKCNNSPPLRIHAGVLSSVQL